jgi:imidazole glycerol-phosphate synthase subunit HisF
MLRNRIIPSLLISNKRLVKTKKFKNPVYLGDPINAIKIFNEKQADEIVVIDITVSNNKQGPNFNLIEEICTECFMPIAYGGGINSIEHIQKLIQLGVEKVILGETAFTNKVLLKEAIAIFGSQSIVGMIDIKTTLFNKKPHVFIKNGKINTKKTPLEYALELQDIGVGELILQDINREGTRSGYPLDVITEISSKLEVPLIALGGAGTKADFTKAIQAGASAAAAGTLFTLQPPHDAVLIKYLTNEEIKSL